MSRRGFIIQGYDVEGNLSDPYLDKKQKQLTQQLNKWIVALPLRGGMADVIPVQFGRGFEPKKTTQFWNYAHSVMTGEYHSSRQCSCPPGPQTLFHKPSYPGKSQCAFVNNFTVVVGQQKPCLYNSTTVNHTEASKLTTGYVYDIPMSRLLIQGLNQMRNESNPRLCIYCDIETLHYGVMWFHQDAEIIQAVLNAYCQKTRIQLPRIHWTWGNGPSLHESEMNHVATHVCCRYGCKQITIGQNIKKCKACGIQQYCSKKCLKKDSKRHAKNCLVLDKVTGNIIPLEVNNNSDSSLATEKPNECITCGTQEKSGCRLKKCGCQSVFYCNKECARTYWKGGHKEKCDQMRAAFEDEKKKKEKKEKGKGGEIGKTEVLYCQYDSCERSTKEGGGLLMKCPCKSVQFCSKEHQKLAWLGHKVECKKIRKALKDGK